MPILGIIASSKFGDVGDFESIATVSLGSGGAADVEFTSIVGTYSHLQIRWLARTDRSNSGNGDYLKLQFNSDTATNYARHDLNGNGTTAAAGAASSTANMEINRTADAGAGSNIFGSGVVDILDYANANKYKTIRNLGGFDNNGTGQIRLDSGLWQNTNAITSIKISVGGGSNILQYSHFALYGIRSA